MTQGYSQVILLQVGEFAKVCNTTERAIRLYEKRGLIKPAKIDLYNNYRYYNPLQAQTVAKIKLLQHFNFTLSQIQEIINSRKEPTSLKPQLKRLKQEINQKQKEYKFLEKINSVLFEKDRFQSQLRTEEIGSFELFCLKVEKGDYRLIDSYIGKLRAEAKRLGIKVKTSEITFYYDSDYQPKDSEMEVALICTKKYSILNLDSGFYFKQLPATKCLTFTFQGSYNYLPLIYQTFDAYIEKENIDVPDPVFEIYLENPVTQKSPLDYVPKICYQI